MPRRSCRNPVGGASRIRAVTIERARVAVAGDRRCSPCSSEPAVDSAGCTGKPGHGDSAFCNPFSQSCSGGTVLGSSRRTRHTPSATGRRASDGLVLRSAGQNRKHRPAHDRSQHQDSPARDEIGSASDRPRSRQGRSHDVGAAATVHR